jgi:hypothetical protein
MQNIEVRGCKLFTEVWITIHLKAISREIFTTTIWSLDDNECHHNLMRVVHMSDLHLHHKRSDKLQAGIVSPACFFIPARSAPESV